MEINNARLEYMGNALPSRHEYESGESKIFKSASFFSLVALGCLVISILASVVFCVQILVMVSLLPTLFMHG